MNHTAFMRVNQRRTDFANDGQRGGPRQRLTEAAREHRAERFADDQIHRLNNALIVVIEFTYANHVRVCQSLCIRKFLAPLGKRFGGDAAAIEDLQRDAGNRLSSALLIKRLIEGAAEPGVEFRFQQIAMAHHRADGPSRRRSGWRDLHYGRHDGHRRRECWYVAYRSEFFSHRESRWAYRLGKF